MKLELGFIKCNLKNDMLRFGKIMTKSRNLHCVLSFKDYDTDYDDNMNEDYFLNNHYSFGETDDKDEIIFVDEYTDYFSDVADTVWYKNFKSDNFKILKLSEPKYQDDLIHINLDINDSVIENNSVYIKMLRCDCVDKYRTNYSICGSIKDNNKEILFISVDKGGKYESEDKFDFYWIEKSDDFKIQDIVNKKNKFPYNSKNMSINLISKLSDHGWIIGEELFTIKVSKKEEK